MSLQSVVQQRVTDRFRPRDHGPDAPTATAALVEPAALVERSALSPGGMRVLEGLVAIAAIAVALLIGVR